MIRFPKSKIRENKRCILLLIFIILVACVCEVIRSKYCLNISQYSLSSEKISNDIRIVQLSDLHNSMFGKKNRRLVEMVRKQSPDIIVLTGDILNSHNADSGIAIDLIKQLSSIASVYCSYGNHEQEYDEYFNADIALQYEKAGATVLEQEYVDINVEGQIIRIGGISGYCLPEKYGIEADKTECDFLTNFQDTDIYTILMCHMPVCWIKNDGINEWDVDCVFSGHVHGGEVILPIVGGVYAPDMGIFPGWLQGLYYSEDKSKVLILSRGLGTKEIVPRFNNVPEIVVADIVPE